MARKRKFKLFLVPRQKVDTYELQLRRDLAKIFDKIKKKVIGDVKRVWVKEAYIPINIDAAGKEYRTDIFAAVYGAKLKAVKAVAMNISRQLKRPVNTRFFNTKIIPALKEKTFLIVDKNIVPGTQKLLADVLAQGMEQGASLAQIIDKLDMIKGNYATIARTEVAQASSKAGWELATEELQSIGGLGKFVKGWRTANDELVRDSHVDAGQRYGEGNEIPMDEEFEVGEGTTMYAACNTGIAKEDINCRCDSYITPKE